MLHLYMMYKLYMNEVRFIIYNEVKDEITQQLCTHPFIESTNLHVIYIFFLIYINYYCL